MAKEMTDEASLPTMEALRSLGFQPDSRVVSDDCTGLRFDFGNFRLSASACMNFRFERIVLFTGILSTADSLTEVLFEMPRNVASTKQCAAWLVWCLDRHFHSHVFTPARAIGWLEEGRANRRLLPWIISMEEYKARPVCIIDREWLKLALKTLAQHLADLPSDAVVVFGFDGAVLSIRCTEKIIALPGEGLPGAVRIKVPTGALRCLPGRLMGKKIGVSIWNSRITLGSRTYEGTLEPCGEEKPTQIQ